MPRPLRQRATPTPPLPLGEGHRGSTAPLGHFLGRLELALLNQFVDELCLMQCPHCFHNLRNEQPDFGLANVEVMHRYGLERRTRTVPFVIVPNHVTGVVIGHPGAKVKDIDLSKNRTFCCGAGGGRMWKEEKEGTRINQKRFDQISEATPETMAVGCPFCLTMMEDALKSRSMEDQMRVRDLSELIAESTGASTK
jgi:Fe-S oxidoreductase